jgi:acylphosphatase
VSEKTQRKRAIASGLVQGVGFRYYVRRVASRRPVTGFVRNLPDGSVEIEAQGSPGEVDSFLNEASVGPPGSRVSGFRVEPAPELGDEIGFVIR